MYYMDFKCHSYVKLYTNNRNIDKIEMIDNNYICEWNKIPRFIFHRNITFFLSQISFHIHSYYIYNDPVALQSDVSHDNSLSIIHKPRKTYCHIVNRVYLNKRAFRTSLVNWASRKKNCTTAS